jgi:hypothetical protein
MTILSLINYSQGIFFSQKIILREEPPKHRTKLFRWLIDINSSEILLCLEKSRVIHLDRSDDYKIRRTNVEELKLWAGT